MKGGAAMKRNVIFFLDLVLQCLALMIVVTSVAAQQRGGVGLVKPSAKYVSVEAMYENAVLDGSYDPLAVSSDQTATSLVVVRVGTSTRLLVSGRHYANKGSDNSRQAKRTTIHVDKKLLFAMAEIRVAAGDDPTPQSIQGTLNELNTNPKVSPYIRFEERPER
jgi:hypothetical protein